VCLGDRRNTGSFDLSELGYARFVVHIFLYPDRPLSREIGCVGNEKSVHSSRLGVGWGFSTSCWFSVEFFWEAWMLS
jgi:hypothetical protein